MPSYDLRCSSCGGTYEIQKRMADPVPPCPRCGGMGHIVILDAPAVHGYMARGREAAVRSLEPTSVHGPECPCCH